ncbi:MAG: MarR family transcriptional regulator [Pseudomonadota bacterium]
MVQKLQLENFLPYRLNRAAAAASVQLSAIYRRKYGLTVPEWRTLSTLAQFGELTAKQIGAHSSMHKTKVSRAVSSLNTRRWLSRKRDAADRRLEQLNLTARGKEAYNQLEPQMLDFEVQLLAGLTATERDEMMRGIAILEKALGVLDT